MRKRKTLSVYGLPYRIELTNDMLLADQGGNQEPCWGSACTQTKVIRIFKGNKNVEVSGEQLTNTLLHELIHVLLRENTALMACLREGAEEMFVDGLGVNLADTLIRNKIIASLDW